MEIRKPTHGDRPAIRDIARRSLQTSYPLEPKAILGAIEKWYDEDRLRDVIESEETLLLVAEREGQIVAFSESIRSGEQTGEILWLHVDPDYRGADIGERLFETTREKLTDIGATNLQGRVLAENPDGNEFYRERGLAKIGEESVTIDGTTHIENVYADTDEAGIEAVETDEGVVYVNHQSAETGSIAPFHVVYTERDRDEIYGYWCSRCNVFANAMDAMGRIQCDECGNSRKPTRWDAAYL
jgi:ribosomal protein S18 acetylase RimI-like enzyme